MKDVSTQLLKAASLQSVPEGCELAVVKHPWVDGSAFQGRFPLKSLGFE